MYLVAIRILGLDELDEQNNGGALPLTNYHINSPITGVIDERKVFLEFGAYEGKSVREVSEIDPHFYDSLVAQKDLGRYILRRHADKSFRLLPNAQSLMDQ